MHARGQKGCLLVYNIVHGEKGVNSFFCIVSNKNEFRESEILFNKIILIFVSMRVFIKDHTTEFLSFSKIVTIKISHNRPHNHTWPILKWTLIFLIYK